MKMKRYGSRENDVRGLSKRARQTVPFKKYFIHLRGLGFSTGSEKRTANSL